jgi:hypothetical protein
MVLNLTCVLESPRESLKQYWSSSSMEYSFKRFPSDSDVKLREQNNALCSQSTLFHNMPPIPLFYSSTKVWLAGYLIL